MSCAVRYVRTLVFPEPAPAKIRSGPSRASTASFCLGLRLDSLKFCDIEALSTWEKLLYNRPLTSCHLSLGERDEHRENWLIRML